MNLRAGAEARQHESNVQGVDESVAVDFGRITLRFEAYADPSPPEVFEEYLRRDFKAELEQLIEQTKGSSAQEAMDQVYQKKPIYLCNACYQEWIEDPTGGAEQA